MKDNTQTLVNATTNETISVEKFIIQKWTTMSTTNAETHFQMKHIRNVKHDYK